MSENRSEFRPEALAILNGMLEGPNKEAAATAFLRKDVNTDKLYEISLGLGTLRQFTTAAVVGNTRMGVANEILSARMQIVEPTDQRDVYNLVMRRIQERIQDAAQQSLNNLNARVAEKVIKGEEAERELDDARRTVKAVAKYFNGTA